LISPPEARVKIAEIARTLSERYQNG
jgi:hypothetical protein